MYVDAAARLGDGLDFDLAMFDAFCVLLRQAGADAGAPPGKPYVRLREGLLDVGAELSRPDIVEVPGDHGGPGGAARG